MGTNFAGNIASSEAWKILRENANSRLVDVRTKTELKFVGAADLSAIGKSLISIPLVNESGDANQNFMQEIEALNQPKDAPMVFICHVGGRSMQAAMLVGQMGYSTYNFENGFCGDANESGQRSKVNGWVASELPWRQA
jgi:rhodanese-related sulfurtransferase